MTKTLRRHQKKHGALAATTASLATLLALGGCATEPPDPPLIAAVNAKDVAQVQTLLAQGAPVDSADWADETALQIAILANDTTIVRLLLAHGADVNHKDNEGFTPLALASGGEINSNIRMVRLLLAHGADSTIKVRGESLQQFAADNNHFRIAALLGGLPSGVPVGSPGASPAMHGQRIALTVNDDCHETLFSDNCDYDNSKTRTFLYQALTRSLTEHGFAVVSADTSPDLHLLVTVTGIGEKGALIDYEGITSATYRIKDADGHAGPSGSAKTTYEHSTRSGLKKLADDIAAKVGGAASGAASMPPQQPAK